MSIIVSRRSPLERPPLSRYGRCLTRFARSHFGGLFRDVFALMLRGFMQFFERRRVPGVCVLVSATMMTAGCASLPTSGPTAHEIVRGAEPSRNTIGMQIVDVNSEVLAGINSRAAETDARQQTFATLTKAGRNDFVGPGDQLDISLFEVGASLFGASPRTTGTGYDPSAQAQHFPIVVVDRYGTIRLPYTGALQVAGKTPDEISGMIESAYRGKSQNPQVLVVVRGNLSETVYVTGDVRKPGRVELTLRDERLLDAIANAGGAVAQTPDMAVRVTRDGRQIEQRLDRVRAGGPDDIVLVAGDRVELIRKPQTFVILGAANRVSQVSFDQTSLTLAEAIGRAGGPNDAAANPKAVFLFRYETPTDSTKPAVPVIYRLNMLDPTTYFLAQQFSMRDKDVLYVSNAAINRTAKFISIVNQLFSPFVAARAVSGN
jgi:polysaccharide export outer membrane protein